jgi:hypothetical protein
MEQSKSPEDGYHFTEDMTTKAIGWVRQQKALMRSGPTGIRQCHQESHRVKSTAVTNHLYRTLRRETGTSPSASTNSPSTHTGRHRVGRVRLAAAVGFGPVFVPPHTARRPASRLQEQSAAAGPTMSH